MAILGLFFKKLKNFYLYLVVNLAHKIQPGTYSSFQACFLHWRAMFTLKILRAGSCLNYTDWNETFKIKVWGFGKNKTITTTN